MKILQIIQKPQLRGAEIFACQLSVELQEKGHDIDVVYLFDHSNFDLHFPLNYISLGGNRSKRFFDLKAYKSLARIIKEGGYDLIQANAGDTLKYASISKKLFGWNTPLVFRNANNMSSFINSRIKYFLNKFFLDQADYIISVSENCRQDLIKLYPRAKDISATGTIGTYDFQHIAAVKKSGENNIWVNVGSFVAEKNHQFLLNIFHSYLISYPKNELWLIGDGPLKDQVIQYAKSLNLESNVKFLGYQKNVISYLKAADIMVMPSEIEGLPGVILEALSCGVPVVASNVGGIPEVVQDGETGFVVDDFKVSSYVAKIDEILNNSDLKSELGIRGQQMIQDSFLLSQIAERFELLYLEIIRA